MAIVVHSSRELVAMRRAGRVAAATLDAVCRRVRAGVSTAQIDAWVRADTAAHGAKPSQLGFHGFPAAVCTSPNEVVCHGVPSNARVLKLGDIINIDVTSEFEGFHGDTSRTLMLGQPSADAQRVVEASRACLRAGIAAVKPGARLGDVGAAIVEVARRHRCGLVREFCGHGIGRQMHMPPQVNHVARAGTGPRLRPGMCFTIEPMLTIGQPEIRVLDDGWTVVTADGSPSAQFEHSIAVTAQGAEVLTQLG